MTSTMTFSSFTLDDKAREFLSEDLAERLHEQPLDSDRHESILASVGSHALHQFLDDDVLTHLAEFVPNRERVLLLRNLPVQPLPPTPVEGYADEPALAMTNALHLGLIRLCGLTPYSVPYENDGRLMRNVVPNPEAAASPSSWGSDTDFSWHTDNPHLPFGYGGIDPRAFIPRYLSFFAMRNDEAVPTDVVSLDTAIDLMDRRALEVLGQPGFTVGAPASNDRFQAEQLEPYPLVEISGADRRVRYDPGTVTASSPRHDAALAQWRQVLDGIAGEELVLGPGDFLIFDNYRILHRRRAFEPGPVTQARWLRRCYAS